MRGDNTERETCYEKVVCPFQWKKRRKENKGGHKSLYRSAKNGKTWELREKDDACVPKENRTTLLKKRQGLKKRDPKNQYQSLQQKGGLRGVGKRRVNKAENHTHWPMKRGK